LRTIIFANGELTPLDLERAALKAEDTILAADGGALHCKRYSVRPDILIGDFDSLPAEILQAYENDGVTVHRYSPDKDFTDLELALQLALTYEPDEILILGGLGGRWDQSIANLLLPASPMCQDVIVRLIDSCQEVVVLRSGESLDLHAQAGSTVSLIPIGGDVHNITTSGLRYPLTSETLQFGATRGISNEMTASHAKVTIGDGFLLSVLLYAQCSSEGDE